MQVLGQPSRLYILLWFLLNVSLTLLNKGVMVFGEFNFPIAISFIHMFTSAILSFFARTCCGFKPVTNRPFPIPDTPDREREITKKIWTLSILFAANIIFGNSSLHHCSVAFVQVVRAIIPMLTMLLSVVFLRTRYTSRHYLSCAIVTVGVGLSCFGEISLTWRGLIVTITGCFLSSAKSIATKLSLSDIHSFELLRRISPIAAVEMLALVFISGEYKSILATNLSLAGIAAAVISGVLAFLLNLTNFLATHHTSPLTVTIVGCLKQVVTIILSVIIFDKNLTLLNALGVIVTTAGSLWYGLLKVDRAEPARPTV